MYKNKTCPLLPALSVSHAPHNHLITPSPKSHTQIEIPSSISALRPVPAPPPQTKLSFPSSIPPTPQIQSSFKLSPKTTPTPSSPHSFTTISDQTFKKNRSTPRPLLCLISNPSQFFSSHDLTPPSPLSPFLSSLLLLLFLPFLLHLRHLLQFPMPSTHDSRLRTPRDSSRRHSRLTPDDKHSSSHHPSAAAAESDRARHWQIILGSQPAPHESFNSRPSSSPDSASRSHQNKHSPSTSSSKRRSSAASNNSDPSSRPPRVPPPKPFACQQCERRFERIGHLKVCYPISSLISKPRSLSSSFSLSFSHSHSHSRSRSLSHSLISTPSTICVSPTCVTTIPAERHSVTAPVSPDMSRAFMRNIATRTNPKATEHHPLAHRPLSALTLRTPPRDPSFSIVRPPFMCIYTSVSCNLKQHHFNSHFQRIVTRIVTISALSLPSTP